MAKRPSYVPRTPFLNPATKYGEGCVVYPYAIVGMQPMQSPHLARKATEQIDAVLGDRVTVGPHAIIYAGAVIRDDCFIGNHASIREGARLGKRCIIGRNVTINYDAIIEDDVHIQDGTHITGGMFIGKGSFIGVNVTTSNDKRREIVDYEFVGVTPPYVGERVLIGSGACIVPGVRIGNGAIIGAGALVTKDVPAGMQVLGSPARMFSVVTPEQRLVAEQMGGRVLSAAEVEELQHRWGRA